MEPSLGRQRFGWYVYDWANSGFYTTVVTVFFMPYVTELAAAGAGPDHYIRLLGIPIYREAWSTLVMVAAVALQVLVLPVVGAIADASASRKRLLALTAYVGSAATIAMYALHGTRWALGGALFVVANLAFGASIVVSNAFLNDLAKEDERDAVSSKGWALGYAGGGLLLVIDLMLVRYAKQLGMTVGDAVRTSLALSGVWWAVFTLAPMALLRDRAPAARHGAAIGDAFRQLGRTLRGLRAYPQALTFLVAYLLYNDAVQGVIGLSGQFANRELGIRYEDLVLVILAVQFIGLGGALLFGQVARAAGAKRAVLAQLVIWIAVIVGVWKAVYTLRGFWVASVFVGLVLGGTQALSRSLYSVTIPKAREAEYYGLYEVADKGSSWLAPAAFFVGLQATHSYRAAIFTLVIFFVLGFAALLRVDVGRGMEDVRRG